LASSLSPIPSGTTCQSKVKISLPSY
jgi:hypothetical protein